MELFLWFCCWTPTQLSHHCAWLRRGFWRYRSLMDWLIDKNEYIKLVSYKTTTGSPHQTKPPNSSRVYLYFPDSFSFPAKVNWNLSLLQIGFIWPNICHGPSKDCVHVNTAKGAYTCCIHRNGRCVALGERNVCSCFVDGATTGYEEKQPCEYVHFACKPFSKSEPLLKGYFAQFCRNSECFKPTPKCGTCSFHQPSPQPPTSASIHQVSRLERNTLVGGNETSHIFGCEKIVQSRKWTTRIFGSADEKL